MSRGFGGRGDCAPERMQQDHLTLWSVSASEDTTEKQISRKCSTSHQDKLIHGPKLARCGAVATRL